MSRRLRVVHVLHSGGIGGVERLALDLLELQRRDPALEPAALFIETAAGGFRERFAALGVPLHEVGLGSGRDLSPAKFRRARRLLAGYDLVHIHVFNPLVAWAAVAARRAVLYTVHGVLAHGRDMRLSDRVNDRLLRRFLNRHVRHVTYNSRATEVLSRERYGLDGVPGEVVYNGIAFAPDAAAPGAPDAATAAAVAGRFVVGTFSRFASFKRIDRLIDGFALFAGAHPQARLLLVGDGALRGELEARVAGLGIGGQVVFTGFRADVVPYQEAMSVCVFPSAAEPFGLVSVEALARGKPVIVFADGGGMAEVVAPCASADVVADVPALAARLAHYAAHPEEITGGAATRRAYARRFDIAGVAAEFRRIYLQVAGGPLRGSPPAP